MAYDKFLIAPFNSGLQTNLSPWLIPDDAFERLKNAYVFRGKVRKRFGSDLIGKGSGIRKQLNSRLRINVGTTDGNGDLSDTVPGAIFKIGQAFSVDTETFYVTETGTPGDMLSSDAGATGTYNTTTGAFVITGAAATTDVYFYPAESVMGFARYEEESVYNNPSIAFDTQFAYKFSGGSWNRLSTGVAGAIVWHGSNSDFFLATNWLGAAAGTNSLFISNFYAVNKTGAASASDDTLRAFDGTTLTEFKPTFLVAGDYVRTAKIIIAFKDRLILLGTVERNAADTTNTYYINRCRFSHNGSPLATSAWYEPEEVGATGGGYVDAPTTEAIVSAEFIKDRLIVYFENSTWELAYTGNQVLPFVWQKINTELGSESTLSSVPFDKAILNIGPAGISACNGISVERIDNNIPDEIFRIRTENEGINRVAGVRDYINELVYWTMPVTDSNSSSDEFPNQVLVYNYANGSWATNEDSITAFGYYEQQDAETWEDYIGITWEEAITPWDSGAAKAQFKQIVAGNQQGYAFIISTELGKNANSLQITNMVEGSGYTTLTVVDHNLKDFDFVKITDADVTGDNINGNIFPVFVVDSDTLRIAEDDLFTAYSGQGSIARVSRIDIKTKWFNPYVKEDKSIALSQVDFLVQRTTAGEVSVEVFPSSTTLEIELESIANGISQGTNVLETRAYDLEPSEQYQKILKHRMYLPAEGEFLQLKIYLSNAQLSNPSIAESDFQLEGMTLYSNMTR